MPLSSIEHPLLLLSEFQQSLPLYIPTTILGLLGMICAYLYYYYRKESDARLETIKQMQSKNQIEALKILYNDLGMTFSSEELTSRDTLKIVKVQLAARTRKYIIFSITLILLSIILGLLVINQPGQSLENIGSESGSNKPKRESADSAKVVIINGDHVGRDKFEGDKVSGDKVAGDKNVQK